MHKIDPIERLPDGTLFRLTPGQLRSVRGLTKRCCNFLDGDCLLLDSVCPQYISPRRSRIALNSRKYAIASYRLGGSASTTRSFLWVKGKNKSISSRRSGISASEKLGSSPKINLSIQSIHLMGWMG